jgi:hypothetical protein
MKNPQPEKVEFSEGIHLSRWRRNLAARSGSVRKIGQNLQAGGDFNGEGRRIPHVTGSAKDSGKGALDIHAQMDRSMTLIPAR